ncbi:hypothetical protein FDENT_5206 [Fusarium denticulatum]|uniref:Uncharacterized protein n=1 Tax=Fusarium denticulatum TaxID=48507 RepID=A0A8H5X8X9_9HYPO|nr:hypothetical protein FDENT_5206 [Fusarium denticulatum]
MKIGRQNKQAVFDNVSGYPMLYRIYCPVPVLLQAHLPPPVRIPTLQDGKPRIRLNGATEQEKGCRSSPGWLATNEIFIALPQRLGFDPATTTPESLLVPAVSNSITMDTQRLGEDIRDELDLSRNRGQIRRKLQLQRPPGFILLDSPSAYDTHGLDCPLTLIRYIHSHLLDVYFDKSEHKDAEERNPILPLTSLDINFNTRYLGGIQPFSCSRPRRIWSGQTRSLGANADLSPNSDAVKVDMSEILIDRNNLQGSMIVLQTAYAIKFSIIRTDNTTELKMCAGPGIIRVQYKTNKNLKPMPFSDFKNTHIPIAEVKGSDPSQMTKIVFTR